MRVTASNVLPGDRVRGIGLVVRYSEPETDFSTRLEGDLTKRDSDEVATTVIVLPNDHVVNVVRSDENFRADQVAAVQAALDERNDSPAAMGAFIEKLTAVANRPRHAYTTADQVADLYILGELDGTESAEEVYAKLDELAQA